MTFNFFNMSRRSKIGLRYQLLFHTTSVAGRNETMETSETNETYFFKAMHFCQLNCGKKARIPPTSKKCYFFEDFPVLELSAAFHYYDSESDYPHSCERGDLFCRRGGAKRPSAGGWVTSAKKFCGYWSFAPAMSLSYHSS